MAMDESHRWIACGLGKGTVVLFSNAFHRMATRNIAPSNSYILCIAFDEIGGVLYVGSESGSFYVLAVPTLDVLHEFGQIFMGSIWTFVSIPVHLHLDAIVVCAAGTCVMIGK